MKVKSIRVQNVRQFRNLKIDFTDEFTRKIRDRTVIVGKNGSGKTTFLETIYAAFHALEMGATYEHNVQEFLYTPAGVEMELEVPSESGSSPFVVVTGGLIQKSTPQPTRYAFDRPDQVGGSVSTGHEAEKIMSKFRDAMAGIEDDPDVGNIVYMPTGRLIDFDARGKLTNEKPGYRFSYKYDRSNRKWEGSLESFLVWLYFRDLKKRPEEPAKFEEFKRIVNRLLDETEITDVDDFYYRVMVKNKRTGERLGLDQLSSGEKQIVLLVGDMFRFLRKGSIVLIDEPEIHLHPVWQRIFVDTMTQLCRKFDAQLIMATQSPIVRDFVLEREVISLDHLLEEHRE